MHRVAAGASRAAPWGRPGGLSTASVTGLRHPSERLFATFGDQGASVRTASADG